MLLLIAGITGAGTCADRRPSEAVGVYAALNQDVYGVDIWPNGVHAGATCSALGKSAAAGG